MWPGGSAGRPLSKRVAKDSVDVLPSALLLVLDRVIKIAVQLENRWKGETFYSPVRLIVSFDFVLFLFFGWLVWFLQSVSVERILGERQDRWR